jgi:hypothetical protein
MATPAQIQANRLNAQKSTGPRSAEGKSVSRFNALKHARDAESLVIPGEDPDALAELTAEYYEQFHPEGPLERYCVDSMISSDWLRRRLRRCEAELYRALTEGDESETPLGAAWHRDAAGPNALTKLFRQVSALDRNYDRAMDRLLDLQRERHGIIEDDIEDDFELADPAALALIRSAVMPLEPVANTRPARQFGFVPQRVGQARPAGNTVPSPSSPNRKEPRE